MTAIATAFATSLLGVALAHLLAIPLPWLLGPIGACLIAALLRVPLRSYDLLNQTMRTILGVAVGATLTPAVIGTFPAMWPTLVLVPVMTLIIGLLGIPYFLRVWRFDFPTAYYAAMPGGLQDMIAFGEEAGASVRTLSLVHATRVLVVVVSLTFFLDGVWQIDLDSPPGAPIQSIPAEALLLMGFCALVGWRVAHWAGLFGASILGPMIAAAIVTLAGGLESRPPAEAIWAAQFFIGMTIGTKYAGITLAEVRRDLAAGLGFCMILIALTFAVVAAVYQSGLAPGMETLLAFAPGGQAEMTVLALIVGADVAFVVAHHILRIVFVILGAPLAARFVSPDPRE